MQGHALAGPRGRPPHLKPVAPARVARGHVVFLAAEAIREFVENNEWQIAEIQAALAEADAEDFTADKDVAALARKWKVNAR